MNVSDMEPMSGLRLVDAAGARALDQAAIETYGIPGLILMENAGRNTVELLVEHFSTALSAGTHIFCGRGNNGGDGFVIARHLHNRGFSVKVYLLSLPDLLRGDAATNCSIAQRMGIPVISVIEDLVWTAERDQALACGLVVDALLGTGLSSPVGGLFARVIRDLNASGRPIASVDIPSGLDARSGQPLGHAIRADRTITYGMAKLGLVQDPALEHTGRLHVVEIGIPRQCLSDAQVLGVMPDCNYISRLLPRRLRAANKGTFGHVLIVAGSRGKVGAAVLSAHAAARSGAGLVTLAVPASLIGTLPGVRAEIMVLPVSSEEDGCFGVNAVDEIVDACIGKQALAVGPGLGTARPTGLFLARLLEKVQVPLVLDADGLNLLSGQPERLGNYPAGAVITPHPGEAARLLGRTTTEIQADRPSAALALAVASRQVVVLKGARTLVAREGQALNVNATGTHGMATGGSGDVLTGMLAGLLAQGLSPWDAARLGVYLHGLAGECAARHSNARALLAGDLIDAMAEAFRRLEEEES